MLAAAGTSAVRADEGQEQEHEALYETKIAPMLTRYCVDCHGGEHANAGLAMDTFLKHGSEPAAKHRETWELVLEIVAIGEMPPEDEPGPTADEMNLLIGWIEAQLGRFDCTNNRDPGRVTLRRLNRVEYNNTIRDLVGVDFQPAEDFPSDDVGYGFDNIGDVLTISPLLVEKYLDAAEKIVSQAIVIPSDPDGPPKPGQLTESHKRLFSCRHDGDPQHDLDCARQILERFSRRAYRRPVHEEEIERLLKLVQMSAEQGESFEQQIALAVQAVLVSPHFLFRVEQDPDVEQGEEVRVLNDHELATRLSYFLWSTMPDERLFELAGEGKLSEPEVLRAEVQRMLEDAKSRALVDNFAGQWLQLRDLAALAPDRGQYPAFDENLRQAMRKETELFFQAVVEEDRSVLDFLDAEFTFLNERLAGHYGISGVQGQQFRRVSLADTPRRGILTQGSILTLTSNPTRTSAVKRGQWILENILGAPPPPPPDVEELDDGEEAMLSGSLRQRLEQHRDKPMCATCHNRMDPLGFAFENFDGIGAWRDRDGNFEIDSSGTLPGGDSFNGPAELIALLKQSRKDQFCRCLVEKMLTYALGRGLDHDDHCVIDEITTFLEEHEYRFSSLILGIALSEPFQQRGIKGGDR